jgi:hypothetical protein
LNIFNPFFIARHGLKEALVLALAFQLPSNLALKYFYLSEHDYSKYNKNVDADSYQT